MSDRLGPFGRPTESVGEVRVVDPVTGGEKGSKPARYDLIPAGPLRRLAEHFGYGATKYADRNWERGYKWSLSFAALNRHLWAFWNGEDIDAESGSEHITAVIWHAMALSEFAGRDLGTDDRPYKPQVVDSAKALSDYLDRTERRYDPLFVGRPPATESEGDVDTTGPGWGPLRPSYESKRRERGWMYTCTCPEGAWLDDCPRHGK